MLQPIEDRPQLCMQGCGSMESVQVHDALAHPYKFIEDCTSLSGPLVRPELAESHCEQSGVFDDFFDFCVFDQLVGDRKLSELTKIAQDNYRQLQSISNYITGRHTLSIYHRRPQIKFNCDKKSSALSFSNISLLVMALSLLLISFSWHCVTFYMHAFLMISLFFMFFLSPRYGAIFAQCNSAEI